MDESNSNGIFGEGGSARGKEGGGGKRLGEEAFRPHESSLPHPLLAEEEPHEAEYTVRI